MIDGLELADVTLDLRLPADRAILERLAGGAGGEGGAEAGTRVPKLSISCKNVSARVQVEGGPSASFAAREVGLSTLGEEPAVSLDGRFSVDASSIGLGEVSGPLSLSGSLSRDFRKARLDLSVAADSKSASLSTQRFELVYDGDSLVLTKVRDRSPLDAALRLDFAGGESSLALKLDGYAPSRMLRLSGPLAPIMAWLDMPYTGSVLVKAPGSDLGRLSYAATLSGSLPAGLLGGGAARAELSAAGDLRSVAVERMMVERGGDRVEYSGSFRFDDLSPDGSLSLALSLPGSGLGLSSSLRVVGHGGEYAAMADEVKVGDAAIGDFALAAAVKGRQVDFNLSMRPPSPAAGPDEGGLGAPRFSGEAGATAGLPLVRCEGTATLGASPGVELSLDLEAVDLRPWRGVLEALTSSAGASRLLASLKVGGSVFATSDFARLSWSAPDLTVVSESLPGAFALLSLSGTTTALSVKRAQVSVAGQTVVGSGSADFSNPRRIGFDASVSYSDIPYAVKGVYSDGLVSLGGDYGLAVSARLSGGKVFATARSSALPIPLAGGLFLATIEAEGRYASVGDWALSVSELDLVPTGERVAVLPEVELAGDFGPAGAKIPRLKIADRFSSLAGEAVLAYALGEALGGRVSASLASQAKVKQGAAPEAYAIDLAYSGGEVSGSVGFTASPLARFGKSPVEGLADGRVSIKGRPEDPSLDFSLKLREGRLLDQSLAFSCSGAYAGGQIDLRDIAAAYQGHSASRGAARFSLADAAASISLDLAGSLGEEEYRCSISAEGRASAGAAGAAGAPSAPSSSSTAGPLASELAALPGRFAAYAIAGELRGLSIGTISSRLWPFQASIDKDTVAVRGGTSGELSLRYSKGGAVSASLRDPFPVRAEVSGLFDGKSIDLSVQGIDFDLGLLQPLMPPDLIALKAGRARGGFRAAGLANDPEITGQVLVAGAAVRVKGWLSDDIGPFDAPFVAQGRRIDVSVPSAPAGKAALALECHATFDHWLPTGLTASARTLERSYVRLEPVILGISATGDAAADLRFALQGDVLALDADVRMQKATVVVSPETLAPQAAPPSRPAVYLAVNTNVRFGRGVRVYFPSTDFPVVIGYSDPASSLAIRYDQASQDFTLKGTVALRGGEVFYIQRNFFLKTGKIVFNEGSDRFEPRVTLLAELRDRNESDEQVVVSLRADNAPISSFKPRLTSDPAMTESQIAMMMGQSLFNTSSGSSLGIWNTVVSGSEFLPERYNVTRVLEDKARDLMGLDMLYLRTQVLQKWLIDFADRSSKDQGNALGRYFDQTELYAGKYLTDSIFAHASMSFRNDPLAAANTLTLDSELGVELDTPFGLIDWSVMPKDFDSLLMTDQSLSLSWKFALK